MFDNQDNQDTIELDKKEEVKKQDTPLVDTQSNSFQQTNNAKDNSKQEEFKPDDEFKEAFKSLLYEETQASSFEKPKIEQEKEKEETVAKDCEEIIKKSDYQDETSFFRPPFNENSKKKLGINASKLEEFNKQKVEEYDIALHENAHEFFEGYGSSERFFVKSWLAKLFKRYWKPVAVIAASLFGMSVVAYLFFSNYHKNNFISIKKINNKISEVISEVSKLDKLDETIDEKIKEKIESFEINQDIKVKELEKSISVLASETNDKINRLDSKFFELESKNHSLIKEHEILKKQIAENQSQYYIVIVSFIVINVFHFIFTLLKK